MPLDYTFGPQTNREITSYFFFENAYSLARIRIAYPPSTRLEELPFFVAIPSELVNDKHVQAVFTPARNSPAPPNSVFFDIYFPCFAGVDTITLTAYPQNTDINNIGPATPSVSFDLNVSQKSVGNAFLLGLEDKDRNVRVLRTLNSPGTDPSPPASYTWTGTSPNDLSLRTESCVAHVTNEFDNDVFQDLTFRSNGAEIFVSRDPTRGGKGHIYFLTGPNGLATLDILPGNKPVSAKFIYFPFAGETSETARIITYNTTMLARDFEEATPIKNPFTFNAGDENNPRADQPIFEINNDRTPPSIQDGGKLFVLVNDRYELNVPASSNRKNIFQTTRNNIVTAAQVNAQSSPAKNNIRYIYVTESGQVSPSREYAFFCYGEKDRSNIINFNVTLSAANEVGNQVTGTNGTGRVQATYDRSTRTLSWNISYASLTGPLTMAHFHGPASNNQTADIIITFTNISSSPITGTAQLTGEQEAQLLAGLWYCNLHTARFIGGELRAQMVP